MIQPVPKPPRKRKKKRPGFVGEPKRYCEKCGRTDVAIHRHHIIPRSRGGNDSEENRVDLCVYCHKEAHGIKVVRP